MKHTILALAALSILSSPAFAWDDTAKKVKSSDLAVQSHKYDGKLIQVRAACFMADVSDYRCMAGNVDARIDFSTVKDETMAAYMYESCDSIDSLQDRRCKFDIQFVYGMSGSQDVGITSLTMIVPQDGVGEFRRKK